MQKLKTALMDEIKHLQAQKTDLDDRIDALKTALDALDYQPDNKKKKTRKTTKRANKRAKRSKNVAFTPFQVALLTELRETGKATSKAELVQRFDEDEKIVSNSLRGLTRRRFVTSNKTKDGQRWKITKAGVSALAATTTESQASKPKVSQTSKSDIIVEILTEAGQPLSAKDITERLAKTETPLNTKQVHRSLASLKKQGRAFNSALEVNGESKKGYWQVSPS